MNFRPFLKRSSLIFVEVLAVIAVALVVVVSLFSWRLLSKPLDLEFAKPYIQEALRDSAAGMSVQMDRVVLFWPEVREPLMLGLQGASIYNADGEILASVEEAALDLNKAQLFLGRVRPEGLILRRLSLSMTRNADNSFDVGVADMTTYGPERPEGSAESRGDYIEEIIAAFASDGEAQGAGSFLSMLKSFEIEGASLLVDDRVLELSWILPRADFEMRRAEEVLIADVEIEFPPELGKAALLRLQALLDFETRHVTLEGALSDFNVSLLAQKIPELGVLQDQRLSVDAQLRAEMDEKLDVKTAALDVSAEEGALQFEQWSPEPIAFNDMAVGVGYDAQAGRLSLPKAQITLGGVVLNATGDFNLEGQAVRGSARAEIDSLAQDLIAPLWPVAVEDEPAKEWIVDKLSQGTFSNVFAQADIAAALVEDDYSFDLQDLVAGFEFEGMSIDYRAPLKPVRDAQGSGVFDYKNESLRIDIESAQLLDINIPEASVDLVDIIEVGAGEAEVKLKLQGPVQSVLTYIQDEPIGAETDIDMANIQGQADLDVQVNLPTKSGVKVEEVQVAADGTLNNVVLPNVVKGLALSEGPFTLNIADNLLMVRGKGKLSHAPIDLEYKEYLISDGLSYSSQVKANVVADLKLREEFGIDLSSFMDGPAHVDVIYTKYQNGQAGADVRADIMPSLLFVEPFDYEKKPGAAGEVSLKAKLQNDILTDIVELTGSAPGLTLETSTLQFQERAGKTELASGKVSRFILDQTVGELEFEIDASGATKIALNGPFLDLRPFLNEDEGKPEAYENPPMQISVAVDAMRTSDDDTVQYGKLYADIDVAGKFNQLEMDAIAGKGDIYLRYKPDGSGKRVFRLEADDAGAALKAFEVYDSMIGGKLVIYGEPIRGVYDRNLLGVAEITDFKVKDAPALARLVSAMSLTGALQTLGGEGLSFTKMEADFDWLYRPDGSLLVLKDGRTSGNSLGLTFDGTFDNAARTLDVSGTIIPLSGVNKVIGDIPLVGDILTGGTGALIAATYSMKGQSDDPKVSVNPLSVLTPGILRRILFEQ